MRKHRSCTRCGGPMEARKVEHPYWHGVSLVVIVKDVPSWVCQLCGLHYYDPAVETTIRFIAKDYVRIGTLFPIPSTPYRAMKS